MNDDPKSLRTSKNQTHRTARAPRTSYLEYAEITAAWAHFLNVYYTRGPTAQKRFDRMYGSMAKKIEGARR